MFTGHLNLNRVRVFGHSLGGTTIAKAIIEDRRLRAGIDLDGNSLLYKTLFDNGVKNSINRPFMLMNSEQFSTASDIEPLARSFYKNKLKTDAYNLTIKGTGHGNFEDLPLIAQQLSAYSSQLAKQLIADPVGSIDVVRGAKIVNNYTLAFFNKYLKSQNSPLLNAPSPEYPEVQFESRRVTGKDVITGKDFTRFVWNNI